MRFYFWLFLLVSAQCYSSQSKFLDLESLIEKSEYIFTGEILNYNEKCHYNKNIGANSGCYMIIKTKNYRGNLEKSRLFFIPEHHLKIEGKYLFLSGYKISRNDVSENIIKDDIYTGLAIFLDINGYLHLDVLENRITYSKIQNITRNKCQSDNEIICANFLYRPMVKIEEVIKEVN